MKKVLVLFLMFFVSSGAYAGCELSRITCLTHGYDASDASNLKKWYEDKDVYRQSMGSYMLAEGDDICIGAVTRDGTACETGSTVTAPGESDERGITVMAAVETTVGGAKFCPTTVIGANSDYCSRIWIDYYVDESESAGCVWLCRDGYTGSRCETLSQNYVSCDRGLLKKSDYDNKGPVTTLKKVKLGNSSDSYDYSSIAMFKSGYESVKSGGTMYYQHDVIFVIAGWSENGHGAWLRPYAVRTWASHWEVIDSAAIFYPAMKTSSGGGFVSKVLGCKDGYKPDSNVNPTKCVAINPTACGESPDMPTDDGLAGDDVTGLQPCSGWSVTSNFNSSSHITKAVGDGPNACYQWRCKNVNYALTQVGGSECKWCLGSKRWGVKPTDGTCMDCPVGTIFNSEAVENVSTPYCEEAIGVSRDVLLYGSKNSSASITDQCWTKGDENSYKKCVSKGIQP